MVFDIIIPTYNNCNELIRCLEAFKHQTRKDFRILICVDGSTDGTQETLSHLSFDFPMMVLFQPDGQRKGRNAARNLALPYLNADYILLFDSDLMPADNLLDNHLKLLHNRNCISLGEVTYHNKEKNLLAAYVQSRGKNKYDHGKEVESYYLTTQNVAMGREHFIRAGGQDPRMIHYGGGDIEFGYRIGKLLHLPVIYNRNAVGFAWMVKDLNFILNQMEEFGAINLHYLKKKYPELNWLFRMDLIESNSLFSRIIKMFLREPIGRFLEKNTYHVPKWMGKIFIHYLFFFRVYKGYTSKRYSV